jgi:hypothetical protein
MTTPQNRKNAVKVNGQNRRCRGVGGPASSFAAIAYKAAASR